MDRESSRDSLISSNMPGPQSLTADSVRGGFGSGTGGAVSLVVGMVSGFFTYHHRPMTDASSAVEHHLARC